MAARAGSGGTITIFISIVIALLIGIIYFQVQGGTLVEKLDVFKNIFFDSAKDRFYEKECVPAFSDSFKRGSEYNFEVDFGPDVEVKNIKYFGFLMECGTVSPFKGADIEDWMVTCHGGPELFDSPMDTGAVCGTLTTASAQFAESNGYETDIECGHKVDVHFKVKDSFLAGTNADLSMCYEMRR